MKTCGKTFWPNFGGLLERSSVSLGGLNHFSPSSPKQSSLAMDHSFLVGPAIVVPPISTYNRSLGLRNCLELNR